MCPKTLADRAHPDDMIVPLQECESRYTTKTAQKLPNECEKDPHRSKSDGASMACSDTWMPPWSVVGMRGLFCLNQSNGGFYLSKYPHECWDSRFPTRKFQPKLVPGLNVVAGRRRHGVLSHHDRLSHLTCLVYLNWTQICWGQLVKFSHWKHGRMKTRPLEKVGLSC